MTVQLRPIDPAAYTPHPLHAAAAEWAETNCATDMWIEILHTWGLDPVAGLAFTVGTDFDGEQWTMFTYPDEDLRLLYGIEVHEMNVWRPVVDHIEAHLALGHLVAVDVDAFYLPDTAGVTYRTGHQKTTITVQLLDRSNGRIGYFHNGGYAELAGDDFDGLFHRGGHGSDAGDVLPPFALTIRLDGVAAGPEGHETLLPAVVERLSVHHARRPPDNPVSRLADRVAGDLAGIQAGGMEYFHRYAFGSCRHLGANAMLAAAFMQWLARHDAERRDALEHQVAYAYRGVAKGAKVAEFTLARAAAGRRVDLPAVFAPLEEGWARAALALDALFENPTPRRPRTLQPAITR